MTELIHVTASKKPVWKGHIGCDSSCSGKSEATDKIHRLHSFQELRGQKGWIGGTQCVVGK